MHYSSLVVAALSLTASALPIPLPAADSMAPTHEHLGPSDAFTRFLKGHPLKSISRSPGKTSFHINAADDGTDLPKDPTGTLDSLLGNLFDDLEELLNSLIPYRPPTDGDDDGEKPRGSGLDPSRQKLKTGTVAPAEPQEGFTFRNIEVFRPKFSLLRMILQLMRGVRKNLWVTRKPTGAVIKAMNGTMFNITSESVKAMCFSNDITAEAKWNRTACTMTVLGFVDGDLVGVLEPQDLVVEKRSVPTAGKIGTGFRQLDANDTSEALEVDEIRLMFKPTVKKGAKEAPTKIGSVILTELNLSVNQTMSI